MSTPDGTSSGLTTVTPPVHSADRTTADDTTAETAASTKPPSFTNDEVNIILADAERLDAASAIRPRVQELLPHIERVEEGGISQRGLEEMADTLHISRDALVQAIRVQKLTTADIREDSLKYGAKESVEIYERRLLRYIESVLQATYPDKKFKLARMVYRSFVGAGMEVFEIVDEKYLWKIRIDYRMRSWANIDCSSGTLRCTIKDPRFLRIFGQYLKEHPHSDMDTIVTEYPTA